MVPRSILITGTSRGIGLELVRQIVGLDPSPELVIATCRTPESAQELQTLRKKHANIRIIKLDVENEDSIQAAFRETTSILGKEGLNVIINNAAIYLKQDSISTVTFEDLLQTLKVNVVGPAIITKTFLPLLRKAASGQDGGLSWSRAAIINVSSILSSMGEHVAGTFYQYPESKAALNQLTKNLSIELMPDGILATSIHPGWVKTDMGGPNAPVEKDECVEGMIKVFQGLDNTSGGKLYMYDGKTLQW